MFLVSFTLLTIFMTCCYCDDPPIVQMGGASVKGKIVHAANSSKPVYAFLGIPYASPPVGDQRFAHPKRLPPINGEIDATNHPPLCPQDVELLQESFIYHHFARLETSEDCLYLNVYTPTRDQNAGLAVMVWIHGGAFVNGGANSYDGSGYATHQNIIFVAINYRLGIFGFLSTEDVNAPGNYGLLDQNMALRWVKSNIKYFGGDPSKVTIAGESAGSMSVGYHFVSRLSRGVFERGIAESGFSTCPLSLVKDPKKWADALAKVVGCDRESTEEEINCLLEKPADDLVYAKIEEPNQPPMIFAPIIDHYFLDDDPINVVLNNKFNHKDILIGVNNHEGGYTLMKTRLNLNVDNFTFEMFEPTLNEMLSGMFPGDHHALVKKIAKLYLGDNTDDFNALLQLTELFGDAFFLSPARLFVDAQNAEGLKSYFYEYEHRPSFSPNPEWVRADHGDEENFATGIPLTNIKKEGITYTLDELQLTRTMMTYWANFIKYGNANGKATNPYWTPYTPVGGDYMKLDITSNMAQHLKDVKVKFWVDLLKEFVDKTPRDEL